MWLVFRYALAAVRAVARERRELALENIALRHQIEVLTRNRRRPQLQPADRLLWSSLSRMWPSWRRHIVIVQPDTVVRWHRTVWRRYWRWKSRGGRRGRPRIEPELTELIRRMTQENPRWGHMRVLGELRKLGFRVSLLTVRRYRKDVPRDPLSSWRTFLENHRPEIWASDFFTVHTLWFQTLYVFFFVAPDRRTVMHVNVTAHPTATWVWRQLINATPWGTTPWGNSPRFLIRDRDRSYGGDFIERAKRIGIHTVLTPIASRRPTASRSGWWAHFGGSAWTCGVPLFRTKLTQIQITADPILWPYRVRGVQTTRYGRRPRPQRRLRGCHAGRAGGDGSAACDVRARRLLRDAIRGLDRRSSMPQA